jgi:hypothetical protein
VTWIVTIGIVVLPTKFLGAASVAGALTTVDVKDLARHKVG